MSSRAAILVEDIQKSPAAVIGQMIAEKRQESHYLEFKGGSKLNEKVAKKYLSKALSGFGNTEGGVLIWGVDARKTPSLDDPNVQIEAATDEPALVPNALEFAEMLKRVKLDATVDPISGVDIWPVPVDGQAGYVVCYVPQGNNPPYRAALDESENYYQRVGDSFVILPHSLLRSLFYPRVGPKLSLTMSFQQRASDDSQFLRGYLFLENSGTGTARNIKANLKIPRLWEVKSLYTTVDLYKESVVSRDDFYALSIKPDLHPGQMIDLCRIQCIAKPPLMFNTPRPELNPTEIEKVDFQLRVFCADHPEQIIEAEFFAEEVNDRLAKEFWPVNE